MADKTLKKALLASALAFGVSSVALAADKPATMSGAETSMLANTCAGCHGTDGASVGPATPTIAGISSEYFNELMAGFKNGEIPSTIMGRIAKGYSEAEVQQMGEFFAKKPFVKGKQKFDAKLAKKGGKLHDKYCEKCHAEGGSSAEDDSGILAGQWMPYLHWQMDDYIAGHRTMTKKMKKKMNKMLKKEGDKALPALLHYYASQQ